MNGNFGQQQNHNRIEVCELIHRFQFCCKSVAIENSKINFGMHKYFLVNFKQGQIFGSEQGSAGRDVPAVRGRGLPGLGIRRGRGRPRAANF